VFLVDDNFIGNKRNVKQLLPELAAWQARRGFPFCFQTEASIDLAADPHLLGLMVRCGFDVVFIGIETPDQDSLTLTKKYQNTRQPLVEAVEAVARAGLRVVAGLIIGFDNERPGAGERIVRFVERSAIPTAFLSLLQALPHTGLWQRLAREGRLLSDRATLNQTALINFVPTRPVEEIAREYVTAFWELYEPVRYLDRAYRFFLMLGAPGGWGLRAPARRPGWLRKFLRETLVLGRALALVCWRQGVKRRTRWKFWHHLAHLLARKPKVVRGFVVVCAQNEHFLAYRRVVRAQIEAQVAESLAHQPAPRVSRLAVAAAPAPHGPPAVTAAGLP
jgi:radical SAM superfamily enzyme YgiQ (UPF0313 family)